jgi:hypothetical protein
MEFRLDPNDWATACGLAWLFEIVGASLIAVCALSPEARDFLTFRIAEQITHGVSPTQVWEEFPRHIADAHEMRKHKSRILHIQ